MAEKNYSKREQDEFRKDVRDGLERIETQTKTTNGRVTKLERSMLVAFTGIAVILVLKYPELVSVLKLVI